MSNVAASSPLSSGVNLRTRLGRTPKTASLVQVVGLLVEHVGDQVLEPVRPHPHVGVPGTHPAPPVGPQQIAHRPVERDRVRAPAGRCGSRSVPSSSVV